jgi:Transposase DDE domain group 1
MIDVDSFLCEVHSQRKQGASIGYTHRLGYHPLIATRADTQETLHIRLRTGAAHTSRGILRFIDELAARVRQAGACGELVLRADKGFWSHKTIARLGHHNIRYSIGVPLQPYVRRAIEAIPDEAWQPLAEYPPAGGIAEIAETMLGPLRLVVRRIRGAEDTTLFPDWRYLAFVTDRPEPLELVEAEHRQHAVIELAIRDHKAGPLRHFPSGRFGANAAWTVISALAANLARWTSILCLADPTPRSAATLRRRLLTTPGRLVRSGRTTRLRLPTRWPWHTLWLTGLNRLRSMPLRC